MEKSGTKEEFLSRKLDLSEIRSRKRNVISGTNLVVLICSFLGVLAYKGTFYSEDVDEIVKMLFM